MKLHLLNGAAESRPALSPARARLADLLGQVAQHERRAEELRTAADRLGEIFEARDKAAADVLEFDRQSAADVLEWSKASLKPSDTRPVVDADKRLALLTELAAAKENADAASRAKTHITAEIQAEAQAAKSLDIDIKRAVAEVIAETAAGPLIEDLQAAQRAVALKQSRLQQALQMIIGIAHSGPLEVMKPTFILMEGLDEKFRTTAPPAVDNGLADRRAWESFEQRLRKDAAAEFEGS